MLVIGVLGLIWAAAAWINVGIYADANGTSGYVPLPTWVGGLGGGLAIIIAALVMNGVPKRG